MPPQCGRRVLLGICKEYLAFKIEQCETSLTLTRKRTVLNFSKV